MRLLRTQKQQEETYIVQKRTKLRGEDREKRNKLSGEDRGKGTSHGFGHEIRNRLKSESRQKRNKPRGESRQKRNRLSGMSSVERVNGAEGA